jgi:hypothetical protein
MGELFLASVLGSEDRRRRGRRLLQDGLTRRVLSEWASCGAECV